MKKGLNSTQKTGTNSALNGWILPVGAVASVKGLRAAYVTGLFFVFFLLSKIFSLLYFFFKLMFFSCTNFCKKNHLVAKILVKKRIPSKAGNNITNVLRVPIAAPKISGK